MLRNNYFGEIKTHYKLYKCGKNWAVMGISVFSLGLGMLVTSRPVSADAAATSTSSSAVRAETTSASSSSATKADSANATSTNEYSASASNLSKTGAASTSNSTAVKTNAKYANSVETVDNNQRGNRENTHSINQRRIVKRSAVVPSAGKITVNGRL